MAMLNWDRARRERHLDWPVAGGRVAVDAGRAIALDENEANRPSRRWRTEWVEAPPFGRMRATSGSRNNPIWLEFKAAGKKIVRMPIDAVERLAWDTPTDDPGWPDGDDRWEAWVPTYYPERIAGDGYGTAWIENVGEVGLVEQGGIPHGYFRPWRQAPARGRRIPLAVICAFYSAVAYHPETLTIARPKR